MNALLCWLLGHHYTSKPYLRASESVHESVLSLHRECLCCGGLDLSVTVNPDRNSGSRYVWSRGHELVARSERLSRPLWSR